MTEKETIKIEDIESNAGLIRGMYDIIRVIDPVNKKVLLYNEGIFTEKNDSCYSQLKKNKICRQCISIDASREKRTFIKIENIDGKMYLISAIPVELKNRQVIVELIKEVTDSLYYATNENESCSFRDVVKHMKSIANKDSLTEIYNRRFIDKRLPIDIEQCIEQGDSISIIMIDVDYFKEINDSFGHPVGDLVLKKFAKALKECIRRKKDWIARYGGEEFLVCIPGSDEKDALRIAKRMQDNIKKEKFKYDNSPISVTASFGIVSVNAKEMTSDKLLKLADEKLYQAKNCGRNRIQI